MNILLINPSQEKVYGMKIPQIYPPLGLLHIGTVLKELGHNVKLLDIDVDEVVPRTFQETLSRFRPRIVGITSVTPTIKDALRWARQTKAHDASIQVIFGGIHATIAPLDLAREKDVDFVVAGEGERTIAELVARLEETGGAFSDIKGILYKHGDDVIRTEPRGLIEDLDEIGFPDRSLLKSLESYVPPDALRTPVATIMTSRGCPGDCTFCCTKLIFSRRVRLRSVDNILREIDHLVNSYRVKEIHIADDTFTVHKKRVIDLCRGIRERGYDLQFEFNNGLRADFIDEDILEAFKSIHVRNLGFGVESGSEEVLKIAKKNISLDTVRRAYALARKFGFETWAFFIIGLPGENAGTVKQTIKLARELDPDFAKFLILKPFPGSEVFEYLSQRNLIESYDYDNYGLYTPPVHHLPEMSKEDMVRWQKRAYVRFYLRPGKVMSHVLRIRSFTQLKLAIRGLLFVFYNMFKKR